MAQPVMHAEHVGLEALNSEPPQRPGFSFEIDGRALDPTHKRWTDAQREQGIRIRMALPTPTDENRAIARAKKEAEEAGADGINGIFMGIAQAYVALESIDGKKIPHLDKETVWAALGAQGRNIAMQMFQRGTSIDPEVFKRSRDSFRIEV